MKVGRADRGPCVDQHRGSFTAIGFGADAHGSWITKTRKHLAADLPAIKLGGWIGRSCPFEGAAYRVDVITVHVGMMGRRSEECKYVAMGCFVAWG